MHQSFYDFNSTLYGNAHHHGHHGHHGHFNSPDSVCTNMTLLQECDTWNIHGYVIQAPLLLPSCLGALIIGMTLAHKTFPLKTRNSHFYAMIFAMVGVMMTFAGITDCLIPNILPKQVSLHYIVTIIDVGLTSTIGYAFLIAAFLDIGLLSQDSPITWALFGSGAVSIFYGWYVTFFKHWDMGYMILYVTVIAIGCGTWVITQFVLLILDKDWASLRWLVLAGAHGGFGLYSIMSQKLITWICKNFGCHFAMNFIWFVVTDTAIYFIYRYYLSRTRFQREAVKPNANTNNQVADETNISIPYNAIN